MEKTKDTNSIILHTYGGKNMEFYSPFLNENQEFLSISKVTYAELNQLSSLDEGYHIEFKLNFNENVKKKIPSIITSYANSDGGWIIIGIDDKSKEIMPIKKERNDFGQIVSQLLKGHVTPIPQYEVRFLECTDNGEYGVLLIYVYKGNFPPYTSNGTIFIRSGSSKEPVHYADGATIESLFEKRKQYKNSIESFFKRDIYFPYNNITYRTRDYSICNIYLKTLSEISIFRSYEDKENIKNRIIGNGNIFQCGQYNISSIMFKHRATSPFNNGITFMYELYNNASAKINIPLPMISTDSFEKEYATNKINALFPVRIDESAKYKIVDGVVAIDGIMAMIKKHIDILNDNDIPISNLALQLECEDIENTILYFDCPLYYKYIKDNGLCYVQKQEEKTEIIYLEDCIGISYDQLDQAIAFDLFAYLFGFHPDRAFEIHKEAQKIRYPDAFD